MKITLVGPSYPYKSGISHFTTILAGKLRQAHGAEAVDFINWKRQYPGFLYPLEQTDKDSKHVLREDNLRLLDFYNPISWIRAGWRVRTQKSDRLVITWVTSVQTPHYLVLVWTAKLFSKARVTLLCHNVLPHDPMFFEKAFTRIMFKFADDFIVHSTEDANDLKKLAPGKPMRIGFHPTYDDFNTGQTYDAKQLKQELGLRDQVIIFFGFIRPYKGLKYLIEAMPRIDKQTAGKTSLLVVGEFWNKNKPEYEEQARQLGVADNVIFVDRFVANEEVGKYFSLADLLVAPYVSATQSGVVQMAYAFDTPVVATKVGGLPEAVDEGVSGFLCPPEDPKALGDTVVKALAYDRYDMASAKARFSWESYLSVAGLSGTAEKQAKQ